MGLRVIEARGMIFGDAKGFWLNQQVRPSAIDSFRYDLPRQIFDRMVTCLLCNVFPYLSSEMSRTERFACFVYHSVQFGRFWHAKHSVFVQDLKR